ncbi:uncharacterized protein [Argopecten irradians]|uniref:uncharacterized protein n=1 Tax=Argopecten irradians TaxID=31199 RepID=UPI00372125A7
MMNRFLRITSLYIHSIILLLLALAQLITNGDSQLFGEEKKYVFVEQAVLERIRPVIFEMVKTLETRVERLEQDTRMLLPELIAMETSHSTDERNACPSSSGCTITELQCPRFYLDPSTLHGSRYMSTDNRNLFNGEYDDTENLVKGTVTTQSYQGARGSRLITNSQILYFEAEIFYRIKQDLTATNLVFEVAFATEGAIGKSFYTGRQNETWSVNAHNFHSTPGVTLFFKSNGGKVMHSEKLSAATSGTQKNLTLGFFVYRVNRVITVFDINRNRKVYTFTDVDPDQNLWPVFGVYQPGKLDTRIRLNTQKDINSVPCICRRC